MHSMSSFATKGVSVSTTRSPTRTDSVSTDNISVTDRHLARLADGDEYRIYARWSPLAMGNRIPDLELAEMNLQIQWTLMKDPQSHQHCHRTQMQRYLYNHLRVLLALMSVPNRSLAHHKSDTSGTREVLHRIMEVVTSDISLRHR